MWGSIVGLVVVPAKYKFKQVVYPVARSLSNVATTTRKKQENNDGEGRRGRVPNEKTDPIVAFSRPPPLPPVLGPLVALSLHEMWPSRNGDDD